MKTGVICFNIIWMHSRKQTHYYLSFRDETELQMVTIIPDDKELSYTLPELTGMLR